ncbi:MAG: gliding motility-associated C-terminal domain-containing protein, partial [Flavobacteriales bacterium]
DYFLEVSDSNNCIRKDTFSITEPVPVSITVDSIIDASCPNTEDGEAQISVSGGTPGYNYTWEGPSGFTADSQDIKGFPGKYNVAVTDTNGCAARDTITIDTVTVVIADAGEDVEVCNGEGPVTLVGSGGTSFEWIDTSDNSIISNDDSVEVNPQENTEYLFITENGVCSDTDTITVITLPLPDADAGDNATITSDDIISIGGSPTGPSGSTFNWEPNTEIDDTTLANPSVSPDSTVEYIVQVTDSRIQFPDGFSPNGDGTNDEWVIKNKDFFPFMEVEIYNRWGQRLYHSKGYDEPWDGTYNNEPVPAGTYYYVIHLNDNTVDKQVYTGPITILR